jgi:hypothetical protein
MLNTHEGINDLAVLSLNTGSFLIEKILLLALCAPQV